MASQEGKDAFDAATKKLAEEAKALSPHQRSIFARHYLDEQPSSADDPASWLAALQTFVQMSGQICDEETEAAVSDEILNGLNAVDIFFSHAPTPEQNQGQWFKNGTAPVARAYERARNVLKCLDIVNDKSMARQDPFLGNLRRILSQSHDLAQAPNEAFMVYKVFEDLVRIIIIAGNARGYNERTRAFVDYVNWVIRGRKDAECHVRRPWLDVEPAELREGALPGVSSLFALPGLDSSDAFSRGEAKEVYRLAAIFQMAFTQYLLHKQHGYMYCVTEHDGIVKVIMNPPTVDMSSYYGIAPDLDISRRSVQAALNTFACCEVNYAARLIVEYFFRSRCTMMESIDFVPKNAHITVQKDNDGEFSSNMAPLHTVIRLTTRNGMRLILDSTASQYGWTENFAPYGLYSRHRIDIEREVTVREAPSSGTSGSTLGTPIPPPDTIERDRWESACLAELAVGLVENQLRARGGLESILCLEQDQFEEECRLVGGALKTGMDAWLEAVASDEAPSETSSEE